METIDLAQGKLAAVWRSDPCAVLYEIAKRRPGASAWLSFGPGRLLLVQDRQSARQLLHANVDNYAKSFGAFQAFFGESRLTTDGDRWQFLRKLSQPLLAGTNPGQLADVAGKHFSAAADNLSKAGPEGGAVFVDATLNRTAAGIVAEAAFGFDIADLGEHLFQDFRAVLAQSSSVAWNFAGGPLPIPSRNESLARAAKERLNLVIRCEADRRGADPAAADLLALLSRQGDEVDLVGELSTLLFAGFDTSAAAMGWALLLLANDPTLQERLRSEVRDVCGDRQPGIGDLEGLSNLIALQNEALRIFPPIPILSRVAKSDDVLAGEPIEVGQRVLLSVIGLHHDPRYFESPADVRPSRFPAGRVAREFEGQFLPFGSGKRMCGGSRFASIELTVGLATMLQRLSFRLADTDPLLFEWNASLRRRGGQRFVIGLAA